jgi:hypothetical protein
VLRASAPLRVNIANKTPAPWRVKITGIQCQALGVIFFGALKAEYIPLVRYNIAVSIVKTTKYGKKSKKCKVVTFIT